MSGFTIPLTNAPQRAGVTNTNTQVVVPGSAPVVPLSGGRMIQNQPQKQGRRIGSRFSGAITSQHNGTPAYHLIPLNKKVQAAPVPVTRKLHAKKQLGQGRRIVQLKTSGFAKPVQDNQPVQASAPQQPQIIYQQAPQQPQVIVVQQPPQSQAPQPQPAAPAPQIIFQQAPVPVSPPKIIYQQVPDGAPASAAQVQQDQDAQAQQQVRQAPALPARPVGRNTVSLTPSAGTIFQSANGRVQNTTSL